MLWVRIPCALLASEIIIGRWRESFEALFNGVQGPCMQYSFKGCFTWWVACKCWTFSVMLLGRLASGKQTCHEWFQTVQTPRHHINWIDRYCWSHAFGPFRALSNNSSSAVCTDCFKIESTCLPSWTFEAASGKLLISGSFSSYERRGLQTVDQWLLRIALSLAEVLWSLLSLT